MGCFGGWVSARAQGMVLEAFWRRDSNRGSDGQGGTWWHPPLVKWDRSELGPQHKEAPPLT